MKKRIISMLLVMVMVLAMLPTVFAVEASEPEVEYVSYLTDSADGKNWIRNNGGTFENGWDFGVWENSEIVSDEAAAFEGNAYAKLTATAEATSQIGVVAVTLPTPGVEVKVTAMVKGDAGELVLHLQHYRNDNSYIGYDNSNVVTFEASEDWQQVVFTAVLPEDVGGTTGGGTETYLIYKGEGTIYMDDVQFFYPIEYVSYLTDSADGVNYALNGGWEEGHTFGGWINAELVEDADAAFEGNVYGKVTYDANGGQIAVVAPMLPTPGVTMKLAMMVKGDAGTVIGHLQHYANSNAHIGNDIFEIAAFEGSENWTQLVCDVMLPAGVGGTTGGGTEIYIKYEGEGTLCIDDVQFFYPPMADDEQEDDAISLNLIANGGFESLDENGYATDITIDGFDGDYGWGKNAFIVNTASQGKNALSLTGDLCGTTRIVHEGITVKTGKTYLYTFKVKGSAVDGSGAAVAIGSEMEQFYDGEWIGVNCTTDGSAVVPMADRWIALQYIYTVPENVNTINLVTSLPQIEGTVYFDDFGLYEIKTKNLIANGGFETLNDAGYASGISIGGFDGDYGWGKNALIVNDAAEGTNALSLTGDLKGATRVFHSSVEVDPGKTYLYTFKAKGSVINGSGAAAAIGSDIEQFNNGEWIGVNSTTGYVVTPVADEWRTAQYLYTAPKNVTEISFATFLPWIEGTVYFDDFGLYEIKLAEDTSEVRVSMVPDQYFIYSDEESSSACVTFGDKYDAAEEFKLDMYIMDGEDVVCEQIDAPITDNAFEFMFSVDALAQKKHAYTLKAVISDRERGIELRVLTEDIYVYDRPTVLNENGEYVNEDGSIFHPVMAFWAPEESDWERVAASGVNTILWSPAAGASLEEQIAQLDRLHALGMKANVVCFWDMMPAGWSGNVERVSEWVEALKDHPAIWAWNIADEPFSTAEDGATETETVHDMMINSYKMIRDIDDKYPVTYVHLDFNRNTNADWYADIILIDTYPGGNNSHASYVADKTVQMYGFIDDSRPVMHILQAFDHGYRPKDYELHSQIYQTFLANGASFGFFGFEGSGFGYPFEDSTDLWPMYESFYASGEYDILLNQYSSRVEPFVERSRTNNVWYDVWETDDGYYIAVQNRTYNDQNVIIALDAEITSAEAVTQYFNSDVQMINGDVVINLTQAQAVLVKVTVGDVESESLVIVEQPESYEGLVGDTVEFTVVAEGEGLTYQWFYKAVGSDEWQKSFSTGATTDTLSVELRTYRDGQQYMCVVTDANGETVESDAAAMTLKVGEFAIVSQPASYAGAEGDTVTFTVAAEGDNLSYRWMYSTDGGKTWKESWSDGYATDTLTVELKAYRDGQQYKCVVSNAADDVLESNVATMSLKESAIVITAQPENATVAAGETVTFTVEATGENLKYRWYRSSDREIWTETWLTGYNTNELSFVVNATRAGYAYKCVITSGTNTVETEAVSVVIK